MGCIRVERGTKLWAENNRCHIEHGYCLSTCPMLCLLDGLMERVDATLSLRPGCSGMDLSKQESSVVACAGWWGQVGFWEGQPLKMCSQCWHEGVSLCGLEPSEEVASERGSEGLLAAAR